jgi:2'-5' RNA ligase
MGTNNSLAEARQSNSFFEYLLVGHPDKRVNDLIMGEKAKFSVERNIKIAAATMPHITIASFLALEAMEQTIGRWTQQVAGSLHSFPVILNKFDGFPKHTLYLGLQDPRPFQQLVKQLKPVIDYIRASGCPPPKLISNPHFSIARGLTEQQYNDAMAEYSQKSFYESFMIEELVLLRRRHQFDKCHPVQVFRFRPPERVSDVA